MDLVTKIILEITIIVYIVSAFMFFIRIIKGPTIFDRVIAVDALGSDLVVFMALIALYTKQPLIAIPMIFVALWVYVLDLYILKFVEHEELGE